MLLGLGTGTTARHFILGVARLVRRRVPLVCVPASRETEAMARALGIPVTDDPPRRIDLTVDGAGEVDGALNLNKGHGGSLVRERLVALASDRLVVIADASKVVERLGGRAVPVEVVPFLWRATIERLARLGAATVLRGGEKRPYLTDNGNLVVDLTFPGPLVDVEAVASELERVPGVVDHGLFTGLATACLVATPDGVEVLGRIA